jgi:SHS2 domain-containing protein
MATMGNSAVRSDRAFPSDTGFELLEHSGDVKLRARGRRLEEVFVNAAGGMMAYLFGEEVLQRRPEQTEAITVEASDREALLVDWLAELLFRATTQYRAYVDFRICEMGERRLAATAGVVAAEAVDDIKAVTHHELSVRRRDDGWEAIVVFDI